MYLPGDIKGFTDKFHLLLAEFLAGNTTFRNELVYVLDALLRLKQLTRREYTDINNRLASTRGIDINALIDGSGIVLD